jgi:plastocyanin
MRNRVLSLAVAVAVIALVAQPAQALFDTEINIEDFRYVPKTHVTLVGFTVHWTNDGAVEHTATTRNSVPGAFSVTLDPAESSTPTDFFDAVGLYPYFCQFHPKMKGAVSVLIDPDGTTKPLGNDFTLTVAADPGTSSSFDVQVKEPRSDRFVTLFKDTTDNTLDFLPARRGVYRVRGRTQNLDGTSTGWSGSIKLTVT